MKIHKTATFIRLFIGRHYITWVRSIQIRAQGGAVGTAHAFYKPTVGMLVHCQKCGHEWAYDKCEACPFCLLACKTANTGVVAPCRVCGHTRTSHQIGQCSGSAIGCRCAEYL